MMQKKLFEQALNYTPTSHDKDFVKHIKNM